MSKKRKNSGQRDLGFKRKSDGGSGCLSGKRGDSLLGRAKRGVNGFQRSVGTSRRRQKRFLGKGVLKAVANVNKIIAKALVGQESDNQKEIDRIMIELDGAPNKSKLGANAILAVSMAVLKASAYDAQMPLFAYIAEKFGGARLAKRRKIYFARSDDEYHQRRSAR